MKKDPLTGETVEVLWVKGSGGDVGSIKMDVFATLFMDKLNALKGLCRGVELEDEMVGYPVHPLFPCLALEGAEVGIRVNEVNPDAVLRDSKIWEGEWLDQRASTYGTDKKGLEEIYRNRSMLKRSVLPEDIAEAAYCYAADASAKSTGNIVNVDAGKKEAFTR